MFGTWHGTELAIERFGRATGKGLFGVAEDAAGWRQYWRRIGAAMRLSARNKINATVTGITKGEATANVALDAGGVRLVASITVEAAEELGLAEGTQVIAVVKASDVIVALPD
jgi:molybdopterin-binding protein